MSVMRKASGVIAAAVALATTATAGGLALAETTQADGVIRAYNNNIENLVINHGGEDEKCTRVSGPEHLESMLVDDEGKTGTDAVEPPDIMTLQQLRGTGQANAYADQLSTMFGFKTGTYKAIVAWEDPQPWGGSHHCADQSLGDLKKKQTNAILYNTKTLDLAAGDVSKYWSAGWLPEGADYDGGKGCKLYNRDSHDSGAKLKWKWKRTSAISARFTTKDTGVSVFAATMHLPEQNSKYACAGNATAGYDDSGIRFGGTAKQLLDDSTIRIIGIDANRQGVGPDTLDSLDMQGYGSAATLGSKKIDYLFATASSVQDSPIDHTVDGTLSNHKALYGFIEY